MHTLNNYSQLSLGDLYDNLSSIFSNSPKKFFDILNDNFDISLFIPDESQFSHFTTNFENGIEDFFNNLVEKSLAVFTELDNSLMVMRIIL